MAGRGTLPPLLLEEFEGGVCVERRDAPEEVAQEKALIDI